MSRLTMQTRQTLRKPISLPGRYFTGLGAPEGVVLSDLSVGGCRFSVGERKLSLGMPVQVYVGESGPHRGRVKWVKNGEAGVTFLAPLSNDLVNLLGSDDKPDKATKKAAGDFEEMSFSNPQRFC